MNQKVPFPISLSPRNILDKQSVIYMGKDKFENEELLKYYFPHDVWFHVDDFSSAHVYLRTKTPITSYAEIPAETVAECAQLTKENSIEGSKKKGVTVIYTWASNLRKEDGMDVGTVTFKDMGKVEKVHVEKEREVLKRVGKTKVEREDADLRKEHEEYMREWKKREQ